MRFLSAGQSFDNRWKATLGACVFERSSQKAWALVDTELDDAVDLWEAPRTDLTPINRALALTTLLLAVVLVIVGAVRLALLA
jgi:hypothetical protein